jgi:putative transposase
MPAARHVERDLLRVEAKFSGLEVSDAKRLRALEEENARLKRLRAIHR